MGEFDALSGDLGARSCPFSGDFGELAGEGEFGGEL